jgi:hypothetical protein
MEDGDEKKGSKEKRNAVTKSYRDAPYFTPNSSTSKISVAFGGMALPAPRAP